MGPNHRLPRRLLVAEGTAPLAPLPSSTAVDGKADRNAGRAAMLVSEIADRLLEISGSLSANLGHRA